MVMEDAENGRAKEDKNQQAIRLMITNSTLALSTIKSIKQ